VSHGSVETHGALATARITYVGHATVLLELDGVRLLTDPVLRRRIGYLRRAGPLPDTPADIDAVLVSHLHHDHLDVPSLRRLPGRPTVFAPYGSGSILRRAGYAATELRPGDSAEIEGVSVEAVRADHHSSRWPIGGAGGQALGFVVRSTASIYFAGDTDLYSEMEALAPVDVALLPVAGWGPRLGPGHMDVSRAAQAVALLRPRVAIPIHWGTLHRLGMRLDQWFTEPGDEFAAQVAAVAPGSEVRVLSPGESTSVEA
jgi:L-ascorbate metabolism protein UlaG (beta-lactamase superfamily)